MRISRFHAPRPWAVALVALVAFAASTGALGGARALAAQSTTPRPGAPRPGATRPGAPRPAAPRATAPAAAAASGTMARTVDVDRVVAVVGTTPILYSEVLDEVNQRRSEGLQLPADSAARVTLERAVLSEMVDAELLVQKAKAEKVEVTDEDLTRQIDARVRQIRTGYPTEGEYRQALRANGLGTPDEYRKRLMDQLRRNRLQEEVYQKLRRDQKLATSSVSDQELDTAYAQNKATLPQRPAMVSLKQIIVAPKPTAAAKLAARAKAESLLVQLNKGADFAELARKYSQDPGSGAQGGDLGWNRRGNMVKEFDEMMFALPVGRVSPIVETQFGYHVIRVDRAQPAEVKARHILIIPARDTADVRRAGLEADSVVAAVRKGADFDSLATRHNDPQEFRAVPDVPIDSLPAAYRTALGTGPRLGTLVGPFAIDDPRSGLKKYVIARVTAATAPGEYPEAEIRAQLRDRLGEAKTMRKLVDSLRRATFVSTTL